MSDYYQISDEFESRLDKYKSTDLVDVVVMTEPDESKFDYAKDRAKKIKERQTSGEVLDGIDSVVDTELPKKDRRQRREEMKQYYAEAMEPIIGYLKEIGKVSDKDYKVLETLGIVSVHLTKAQIYEIVYVDNVAAIIENQKVYATNNKP